MFPCSLFKTKKDFIDFIENNRKVKNLIKQKFDLYKNNPIIILIGMIGVGKSSISCILNKKSLIVESCGMIYYLNGEGVGLGLDACTIMPAINYNANDHFLVVDLPGFEDNYQQEISNSIIIDSLFEACPYYTKQYKIILVISDDGFKTSKCTKIIDSFSRLMKMFPKYEDIKQTFVIMITKGDAAYEPKEYINMYNDMFNNTTFPTNEMKKIHEFFNSFRDNIFTFPKPSNENIGKQYNFKDYDRLLRFLKNNYCVNPDHRIVVSNEAESNVILSYDSYKKDVENKVGEICTKIKSLFQYENSSSRINQWLLNIRNITSAKIENTTDLIVQIKKNISVGNGFENEFKKLTEFQCFEELIKTITPSIEDKSYLYKYVNSWSILTQNELTRKYNYAIEEEKRKSNEEKKKKLEEEMKKNEERIKQQKREIERREREHLKEMEEIRRQQVEDSKRKRDLQNEIQRQIQISNGG